jgi:acyl-CoA synthetase (AMP-forming)/AMP-acid ligase II
MTLKLAISNEQKKIFNVASYLPQMAEKKPFKRAVVFPQGRDSEGRVAYTHLTFSQLNAESSRYAYGLKNLGIEKGCRVLLMVKPGLEFVGLAFALFRIGAVPILIDPGMGVSNLLNCIKQVEPEGLIAVPIVHIVKTFKPKYFSSIKYSVTVGKKLFWEGTTLERIQANDCNDFPPAETQKTDQAAILFTTGSTGPPKGVLYKHGMFGAQVEHIKSRYGIDETDMDMPAFPLFALFSAAIGMTCIIPDMNPTKPAMVDPKKIVEAIKNHGITNSFGSPALWNRVSEYCLKHDIQLPTIRRILMAGAPVPGTLLEELKSILSPNADTYTPYGATEALPITSISGSERLADTEEKTRHGAGTCVGKPLDGITIKIIRITDEPISAWDESFVLKQGEIGEIVVKGDVVTQEYFRMKVETNRAKITDGDTVWHRMGDIGYIDEQNRVWFCGRKAHRVITKDQILFSGPCEAIFNQHPKVFRSALVGVGPKSNQRPVIVIEPQKGEWPKYFWDRKKFAKELLEIGQKFEHTREIGNILFHASFPVDIRHNVKISREKLAAWAEGRMK